MSESTLGLSHDASHEQTLSLGLPPELKHLEGADVEVLEGIIKALGMNNSAIASSSSDPSSSNQQMPVDDQQSTSDLVASSSTPKPPSSPHHDSTILPTPIAASDDPVLMPEDAASQGIDVDLGAIKSVSRLHAKIVFDAEEAAFVLEVLGRNGAWVDDEYYGPGQRASLSERLVDSQVLNRELDG